MGFKLYELGANYKAVIDLIDDENFEQLADTIDAIDENLKDKVNSIFALRLEKQAEAKAYDEEIKRLKALKDRASKTVESLENYVDEVFKKNELDNITTSLGAVKYKKNPASIEITDADKVPEAFYEIETVKKINKTALKKWIKQRFDDKNLKLPDHDEYPEIGVKLINDKKTLKWG